MEECSRHSIAALISSCLSQRHVRLFVVQDLLGQDLIASVKIRRNSPFLKGEGMKKACRMMMFHVCFFESPKFDEFLMNWNTYEPTV